MYLYLLEVLLLVIRVADEMKRDFCLDKRQSVFSREENKWAGIKSQSHQQREEQEWNVPGGFEVDKILW